MTMNGGEHTCFKIIIIIIIKIKYRYAKAQLRCVHWSMVDGVAAAVTETVVVSEVVGIVTVSVVLFLDVDGHVFVDVYRVRYRVGHRNLDRP